jgi:hypothetical protein
MRPLIISRDITQPDRIRCIYSNYKTEGDKKVIICSRLTDTSQIAYLDWIFEAEDLKIGNHSLKGFSYTYKYRGCKSDLVIDRTTWELGGRRVGNRIYRKRSFKVIGPFPQELSYEREAIPIYTGGLLFAGSPFFDFQTGDKGTLVGFPKDIMWIFTNLIGYPDEKFLRHIYWYKLPSKDSIQIPYRYILYTKDKGEDVWSACYDYLGNYYREKVDLKEIEPLPMLILQGHSEANDFDHVTRKILPEAHKLGFKRIHLGPLWKSGATEKCGLEGANRFFKNGNMAVYKLEIAERYDGSKGLRKLISAAHKYGMQVQKWYPTDLGVGSPLLQEHPDWIITSRYGKPFMRATCAVRATSLYSGFWDYALGSLRKLRQETGLDGLFFDTFSGTGMDPINYGDKKHPTQVLKTIEFLKELQKMGYKALSIEAYGPFGLPLTGAAPRVLDETMFWVSSYKTCLVVKGRGLFFFRRRFKHFEQDIRRKRALKRLLRGLFKEGYYFKSLANKGPFALPWYLFKNFPQFRKEVGRLNHIYTKLYQLMQYRYLICDEAGDKIAILWKDKDHKHRVLFALKDAWFKIPAGVKRIFDMTDKKYTEVEKGAS